VRPSAGHSWPFKIRSCLISADAGGVGYCTALTPTLFFTSGLGLGVRLMSDEDALFQSGGVGHESESVHWYNIP
jgi:hypothetical protein